jgi:hypothetical protein
MKLFCGLQLPLDLALYFLFTVNSWRVMTPQTWWRPDIHLGHCVRPKNRRSRFRILAGVYGFSFLHCSAVVKTQYALLSLCVCLFDKNKCLIFCKWSGGPFIILFDLFYYISTYMYFIIFQNSFYYSVQSSLTVSNHSHRNNISYISPLNSNWNWKCLLLFNWLIHKPLLAIHASCRGVSPIETCRSMQCIGRMGVW